VSSFHHVVAMDEHTEGVTGLAWAPEGKWLASAIFLDRLVHFWVTDVLTDKTVFYRSAERRGQETPLLVQCVGNGGKPGVREAVFCLSAERLSDRPWSVAFTHKGDTLAGGAYDHIRLWKTASWEEKKPLRSPRRVDWRDGESLLWRCLSFDRHDRLLAAGTGPEEWTASVYDLHTGDEVFRHAAGHVAFSPTEDLLALTGGNTIELFDSRSWQMLHRLVGHQEAYPSNSEYECPVVALAFSPDGKCLATGTLDIVYIWDIATSRVIQKLSPSWSVNPKQRQHAISSIAFSPDGRLLAFSAIHDSTVRLYHVNGWSELPPLGGHKSDITLLAFGQAREKILLASSSVDVTNVWSC